MIDLFVVMLSFLRVGMVVYVGLWLVCGSVLGCVVFQY